MLGGGTRRVRGGGEVRERHGGSAKQHGSTHNRAWRPTWAARIRRWPWRGERGTEVRESGLRSATQREQREAGGKRKKKVQPTVVGPWSHGMERELTVDDLSSLAIQEVEQRSNRYLDNDDHFHFSQRLPQQLLGTPGTTSQTSQCASSCSSASEDNSQTC